MVFGKKKELSNIELIAQKKKELEDLEKLSIPVQEVPIQSKDKVDEPSDPLDNYLNTVAQAAAFVPIDFARHLLSIEERLDRIEKLIKNG